MTYIYIICFHLYWLIEYTDNVWPQKQRHPVNQLSPLNTYAFMSLFFKMNFIKYSLRNKMTNEFSFTYVSLKVTQYERDIKHLPSEGSSSLKINTKPICHIMERDVDNRPTIGFSALHTTDN